MSKIINYVCQFTEIKQNSRSVVHPAYRLACRAEPWTDNSE